MASSPLSAFVPYLAPYKGRVAIGLLWLLGVQTVTISLPLLLKWAVDVLEAGLQGRPDPSVMGSIGGDIAFFAGLVAALALLEWLMSIAMRWNFGAMSRLVERDLRQRYTRHLLRLPLAFFQRQRVGDLVARATNDVESIQRFLYFGLRMGFSGSLTFVLSLILMIMIILNLRYG